MTDDTPAADPATTERMHAIVAGLKAAGLDAHVHQTRGVLDIAATWQPPGSKGIDLTIDDDEYMSLSWRSPAGSTPAQVTATISRVLTAITQPS